MNVVVAVAIFGAVASIATGLCTAVVIMALKRSPKSKTLVRDRSVYWSFAAWTIVLGVVLMAAPHSWFGPSWHYFLPHNGFGMGLCLALIGTAQILTLHRGGSDKTLSTLFFMSGFVYWTAGIIIAAEGLLGHQGLMEAPFMLYVGAHKFTHSAKLMADA
jgi:hypothetical protein